jgi:hypothetical protein
MTKPCRDPEVDDYGSAFLVPDHDVHWAYVAMHDGKRGSLMKILNCLDKVFDDRNRVDDWRTDSICFHHAAASDKLFYKEERAILIEFIQPPHNIPVV